MPEEDVPMFADLMAELWQAEEDEAADEDDAIEEDDPVVEDLFGAAFLDEDGSAKGEAKDEDGGYDTHPKEDEGVAEDPAADGLDAEEEFYRSIGLQLVPGWKFNSLDGRYVGKLRFIGGHSYKADCTVHEKCYCWLSSSDAAGERAVVRWISRGPTLSRFDHLMDAYELKRSFGMSPKKPKPMP